MLIALIVLLPLVAGILLVSGMFKSRLVLSDDVAELRQRHGRPHSPMPAFDPSVCDLTGLAAEARTLIAPLERLELPEAGASLHPIRGSDRGEPAACHAKPGAFPE